jgi:hypothetical protein
MQSFQWWRQKSRKKDGDKKDVHLNPEDEPKETRRKILSYLREQRRYYVEGNERYQHLWNWLNIGAVCLSFAGSILAALSFIEEFLFFQILAVFLPAAAGACSTALIQFRIRELWQLRDDGRMEMEYLICRAHMVGVGATDKTKVYEEALELRQEAHDLERRQSAQFFSFLTPAFHDDVKKTGARPDADKGPAGDKAGSGEKAPG